MKRVTVICCYNDAVQFDELKNSLESQSEEYDLIPINNVSSDYSSCSKAFNAAMKKVKTTYVVFTHQDIILNESNMLKNFVDYLEKINVYDILGVAGVKRDSGHTITNILHGKTLKPAGSENLKGMEKCETVDECFFGGTAECFSKYPFNETLCDNWHLYAVERCINAAVNGNSVYVCDIPLIHNSQGKINHAYNVGFLKISKFYADKLDCIYTTCASAKTNFVSRIWAYIRREISIKLNRY